LAGKSGGSLKEIVTLVDLTTSEVNSIAAASQEQSAASEEIARSVEDVNRVSVEMAEVMHQSAAAVSDLAEQALKLSRLIELLHTANLIDAKNDWSVFGQRFDDNLVYQFHYYCWDHPATLKTIQPYLEYRDRLNAPVWVGETGERDNAIYWATTEYFEANNIGWAFWPWKKMDTHNTPNSIKPPAQWNAVTAYSRGGPKPSSEVAQAAFTELVANIRLENCAFFPDVVNAMLRRAPARIEGENFGQEGLNKSYFVKDASRRSKVYRPSEPVMVTSLGTNRWQSGQFITLGPTEWTAYTIRSGAPKEYRLTLRAKAAEAPAEAQIAVGDQVRSVTISGNAWSEIKLGAIALAAAVLSLGSRRKWISPRALRLALGWAIAGNELIWWTFRYAHEGVHLTNLPLQLCDATVWATVLACLACLPLAVEFSYFMGLAGAGMALLTPDLWSPWPSYPAIYFFLAHGGIVVACIVMVFGKIAPVRRGAIMRVFVLLLAYALVVGVFDALTGANYMYLARKPKEASLLDFLGPWPVYVVAGIGLALALCLLLWIPVRLMGLDGNRPPDQIR